MEERKFSSGGVVMAAPHYTIKRDCGGHWLVSIGETEKPVALFYAHNVPDHIARRRAEKFIKAIR